LVAPERVESLDESLLDIFKELELELVCSKEVVEDCKGLLLDGLGPKSD